MIVISLVKTLGIPMYILNLLNLENIEWLEAIILWLAGLVSISGSKGLVQEIFINNYATMGGEDPTPTQESSSGSQTGGVGATNTSDGDIPEKGRQSLSDGNRQPKSGSSPHIDAQTGAETSSNTQKEESSSSEPQNRKYSSAKQLGKALGSSMGKLGDQVKNLSISMDKANDDEWEKLKLERDEAFDTINMVAVDHADQVKKEVLNSGETTSQRPKRGSDAVEKEENEGGKPSKKTK